MSLDLHDDLTFALWIAAATRLQSEAFDRDSLLGRSLVQEAHAGYRRCIAFANHQPLAITYNRAIDEAEDTSVVAFCHDDLWLGSKALPPLLEVALQDFDLVGVAGNRRCALGHQAWWLAPDGIGWDQAHLVGRVRHGAPGNSTIQRYGPSPAPAALLDGVFLAGRASVLRRAGLRFDPALPFHFYDLDFCRSALAAGLRIGVWPFPLIHASGGEAFTTSWKASLLLYRRKWEGGIHASVASGMDELYALARAHQLLQQWPEALAGYEAVLDRDPHHGRALQQRALVLHQLGRDEEALASLDAFLLRDPANPQARANRAGLLMHRRDLAGAEAELRQALASSPSDSHVLHRLATLLARQHRHAEAVDVLRQLLRHNRDHVPALLDLGGLLMEVEQFGLARAAFQRALRQQAERGPALFGLGLCLEALGDLEAALVVYERGLNFAPHDINFRTMAEGMRQGLCLWQNRRQHVEALRQGLDHALAAGHPVPMALPMRLLSFPLPLELQREVARRHAAGIVADVEATASPPAPTAWPCRSASRPLRIGYLSADFRCHAMGGLIHGLFAHHDRSRCVPIGYMLAASRDRFTRSVARGCERLRDVSRLGNDALARLIRDDGIDVLVDLMGYTHQARPAVLALRPAPLQLLYLGYPGTSGAPFIDGVVGDHWLIPPQLEDAYSEQVLRLPWAFVCSPPLPADPAEPLPPPPSRAALGLGADQMVFSCLNRPDKFDPERFDCWIEILRGLPGSVLLLVVSHPGVCQRLRQRAASGGVDPQRLVFTHKTPAAHFPALCAVADLFLDTAHYGAGATGAMALQAGLPLLTCPGDAFVSRMGASLCAAVGMEFMICETPAVYMQRAIQLGRDPRALKRLRACLLTSPAGLPLFNTAQWVRHWEALLHQASAAM